MYYWGIVCDFPAVHWIFIEQTVLKSGTLILIRGKSAPLVPKGTGYSEGFGQTKAELSGRDN